MDFLLRVAPRNEPARRDSMNAAALCLAADYPAVSARIDELLMKTAPGSLPASLRAAHRAFARGDYHDVIERMRQIRRREPNTAAAFELEAAALCALGEAPVASALLTSALGRTDSDRTLLVALATAEAKSGNAPGMRVAIARLRAESGGKVNSLAQVMAHLSKCEALLGNDARALKAMLEAHRLSETPDYLAEAAQLALKLGQKDFVLRVWTQLCESQSQSYCAMRDQLQKQMVEGMLVP